VTTLYEVSLNIGDRVSREDPWTQTMQVAALCVWLILSKQQFEMRFLDVLLSVLSLSLSWQTHNLITSALFTSAT
jgi:hypothetical protein